MEVVYKLFTYKQLEHDKSWTFCIARIHPDVSMAQAAVPCGYRQGISSYVISAADAAADAEVDAAEADADADAVPPGCCETRL